MRYLALIIIFINCGCTINYKDVSQLSEYKPLLMTRYELTKRMYISGINLPPGYGKDINIFSIEKTNPTWAGPELISRDTLEIGTILTILSIRKSTHLLDRRVEAIVDVKYFKKTADVPIEINMEYIKSNEYVVRIK